MFATFEALTRSCTAKDPHKHSILITADIIEIHCRKDYKAITLVTHGGDYYHIYFEEDTQLSTFYSTLSTELIASEPVVLNCLALVDHKGVELTQQTFPILAAYSQHSEKSFKLAKKEGTFEC